MSQQLSSVHRYRFLSFDKGPVSTLDENLPPFPRSTRRRRPPEASAGLLDRLPTELLHLTLTHLDIRSLIDFRLTNIRAAEMVDYLPQFRAVSAHARNALRGILAIGTGRWITCATLYEKLCTSKCDCCGGQGGYLYLVTCKRVCFRCLSLSRFYHPLPLGTAASAFNLYVPILRTLPHMTALPGTYAPNETITEPLVLVDFDSAVAAGIRVHGCRTMIYYKARCRDQSVLLGFDRGFVAKGPGQRHLRLPLAFRGSTRRPGNSKTCHSAMIACSIRSGPTGNHGLVGDCNTQRSLLRTIGRPADSKDSGFGLELLYRDARSRM